MIIGMFLRESLLPIVMRLTGWDRGSHNVFTECEKALVAVH